MSASYQMFDSATPLYEQHSDSLYIKKLTFIIVFYMQLRLWLDRQLGQAVAFPVFVLKELMATPVLLLILRLLRLIIFSLFSSDLSLLLVSVLIQLNNFYRPTLIAEACRRNASTSCRAASMWHMTAQFLSIRYVFFQGFVCNGLLKTIKQMVTVSMFTSASVFFCTLASVSQTVPALN